jgi:hypothetical protein
MGIRGTRGGREGKGGGTSESGSHTQRGGNSNEESESKDKNSSFVQDNTRADRGTARVRIPAPARKQLLIYDA